MPSSNEVERGPAVALEPALALMLSRTSEANINQLLRGASMFWPLSHGCMLALNAPLPTPAGTPGLYSGGMTALAGAKAGVKVGCKRRRACSVAGEIGDTVEDGGSGPVGGEAHTAANAGQSGCGGGGKRPRLSMWRRRKQRRAEAATAASTAASGGPQPLPLLSPSLPLPLLPPRSQTLTVTDEAKSVEVGCGAGTFSEATCGGDARGRGGSARDGDDAVRPGGARRQGRRWMQWGGCGRWTTEDSLAPGWRCCCCDLVELHELIAVLGYGIGLDPLTGSLQTAQQRTRPSAELSC